VKVIKFSFIILFSLILTACSLGAGTTTTLHNDEINKKTRSLIEGLDTKVIDSIKNNNVKTISEISSEAFKSELNSSDTFTQTGDNQFKNKSFEYRDQYLCKFNKVGDYNFTIATLKNDPFSINLKAESNEMFISLLKSNSGVYDYLVANIYIKENNEWKLRTVSTSDYSFNKMSPLDFYENAKSLKNEGYTIPACLYMNISNKMLRPAPFIQYKKEKEIKEFTKKLLDDVNSKYTFPIKVKEVDSNIEVCGLDVICTVEGIVPVIKYTTEINLNDGDALKTEANKISSEVLKMYPGMKETFKIFLFEAYSEIPSDPQKTYNNFRTIIE
jgi:hypothetical protein